MLQQFHIAHSIGLCKTYLVWKFEVSSFKNGPVTAPNVADQKNGLFRRKFWMTLLPVANHSDTIDLRLGNQIILRYLLGVLERNRKHRWIPLSVPVDLNTTPTPQPPTIFTNYCSNSKAVWWFGDIWRCNLAIFEARDLKFSHQVGLAKPDSMSYVKLL